MPGRMIENQQKGSLTDDLKQLRDDAEQLAQRQEKIQEALDKLSQGPQGNRQSFGSDKLGRPE